MIRWPQHRNKQPITSAICVTPTGIARRTNGLQPPIRTGGIPSTNYPTRALLTWHNFHLLMLFCSIRSPSNAAPNGKPSCCNHRTLHTATTAAPATYLLTILQKRLDRAILFYIFIREVRLSGGRSSISIVHIRKFYKIH